MGFTAIVVDDYVDMVEIFSEHLQMLGIQVVGTGHNGKDAVEIYRQKKPDLVFLDLMMPEYDGFYALATIRKIDPNSKVVIITADMRDDTAKKLDALKPTKVFFKPHDVEQIKKFLDQLQKPENTMISHDKSQNALVSFVVYDTLKQISESALNEVGHRLYAKYGSYFSSCLEHPEYLRDILKEIFGDACKPVMDTIKEKLEAHAEKKQISDFLVVLNA